MGNLFGTVKLEGLTSASGAVVELKNKYLNQQSAHQLSLIPDGAATGTVPVLVRPKGAPADYSEPLLERDGVTPVEIDLAAPATIVFPVGGIFIAIDAVVLDCTGVTGAFGAILESR